MKTFTSLITVLIGAAACSEGGSMTYTNPVDNAADTEESGTSGGEDNTYEHPGGADIWDYLDRLAEEGPPEFTARLHGCAKPSYDSIGRVLASYGVDLNAARESSAGYLWRMGSSSLGAANLAARAREARELTTAAASRLLDIYVQAAPEIIAALPTLADCTLNGTPIDMFNEEGQCTTEGVSCLLRAPASLPQIELCNEIIARASSVESGKQLAVATLIASANTCE